MTLFAAKENDTVYVAIPMAATIPGHVTDDTDAATSIVAKDLPSVAKKVIFIGAAFVATALISCWISGRFDFQGMVRNNMHPCHHDHAKSSEHVLKFHPYIRNRDSKELENTYENESHSESTSTSTSPDFRRDYRFRHRSAPLPASVSYSRSHSQESVQQGSEDVEEQDYFVSDNLPRPLQTKNRGHHGHKEHEESSRHNTMKNSERDNGETDVLTIKSASSSNSKSRSMSSSDGTSKSMSRSSDGTYRIKTLK